MHDAAFVFLETVISTFGKLMDPNIHPVREKYPHQDLQRAQKSYLAKVEKFQLPQPDPSLELIVVIPVYNEQKALPQLLQCLQKQTIQKKRFEIVAVDNNSTDQSGAIIQQFSLTHGLPVQLVHEQQMGCLKAIHKGMEWALARFAQCTGYGAIAVIDADDEIGPFWAETMLNCLQQSRSDMVRGPVAPGNKQKNRHLIKKPMGQIFHVENHLQAYINLVRSHLHSMLYGQTFKLLPWLPRITGPNMILHTTAYIAAGGLNPTPPGDQSSKIGSALLRLGFPVYHCSNPDATAYRSVRRSHRNYQQAGGFGVGFGPGYAECLSINARKQAYRYPNPEWLKFGFEKISQKLNNQDTKEQAAAKQWVLNYLSCPPDPNPLYRLGQNAETPAYVTLDLAEILLPVMISQLQGTDYRSYERFLLAREHIRQRLLLEDEMIDSEKFVTKLLKFFEINPNNLYQTHILKTITELKQIPALPRQSWFEQCSSILEIIYKELSVE